MVIIEVKFSFKLTTQFDLMHAIWTQVFKFYSKCLSFQLFLPILVFDLKRDAALKSELWRENEHSPIQLEARGLEIEWRSSLEASQGPF